MIDMTGDQRHEFIQNWHNEWIKPELDRRFGMTAIPSDFKIWTCRILLPIGQDPIVQFNDEIGWYIENPKLELGKTLNDIGMGEPVHIFDILGIDSVLPPKVNDEPVAFMFLYWGGFEYHLFIEDQNFKYGSKVIASYLQSWLIEKIVQWAKLNQSKLHEIGLWTATPILPYPLSKIVKYVEANLPEKARETLIEYCDSDFIHNLVDTWKPIRVFNDRLPLFYEAVSTHQNRSFRTTIYALVPQIEGLITDWLHTLRIAKVEHKLEDKVSQFNALILSVPQFEFAYREALNSCIEFMLDGPPLQKFGKWLNVIDSSFAGRHPITHGKYQDDIFTEENSIKLFLLLDTICQFMVFYEVRVLGRDLGQNKGDEVSSLSP